MKARTYTRFLSLLLVLVMVLSMIPAISADSPNLCTGAAVTASSHIPSHATLGGLTSVVDGSYTKGWSTNPEVTDPYSNAWIQLELTEAATVDTVKLYPRWAYAVGLGGEGALCFPADFTIQVSSDGSQWKTVVSQIGYQVNANEAQVFSFPAEENVKFLKVDCTKMGSEHNTGSGTFRMQFMEIEAFNLNLNLEPVPEPTYTLSLVYGNVTTSGTNLVGYDIAGAQVTIPLSECTRGNVVITGEVSNVANEKNRIDLTIPAGYDVYLTLKGAKRSCTATTNGDGIVLRSGNITFLVDGENSFLDRSSYTVIAFGGTNCVFEGVNGKDTDIIKLQHGIRNTHSDTSGTFEIKNCTLAYDAYGATGYQGASFDASVPFTVGADAQLMDGYSALYAGDGTVIDPGLTPEPVPDPNPEPDNGLPNNAKAIVARDGDAYVKSAHPFQANWIWSPSDDGAANRWMALRKDVTLSAEDLSGQVTAKIAADTKYWLWINGEVAVFEGQLKRGPALLKKDIYPEGSTAQPNLAEMIQEVATYYDEVDITPWLKEGENTIVALVWYFGNEGHSHVGSGKGGFLFESQMGSQLILSDASWKVSRHLGYKESSGVGGYAQEFDINYDAQFGFNDFYKPEFDVSGWEAAAEIGKAGDKPWNELWPRTIPEWKVWERVAYGVNNPNVTVQGTDSYGVNYRVNLPTNIQFVPYLKVKAEAGKVIRITCPNAGGSTVVYTTTGGTNGEAVVQEFESPAWINWWYVNFNIPTDVEVIGIGYRQTGYNTELTGSFTSNDEFFNTLWTKARDTVYVNIRDTFMDCPDRERAPWLGDMVNEAMIAYYSMDSSIFDMIRKDVSTRINWQNADGVIPTTVPMTFRHNEYAELTGQSLAGVKSWWDHYLYSGDRYTLEQSYEPLLKYMEMFDLDLQSFTVPFARRNGTNTVHLSWVDWGSNIDKDLCLNIWAYIGVQTVINYAQELGDTETQAYYEAIRDEMHAKFDDIFWNGTEYRSSTYTGPADDRGQALAVVAGLVSPDKYEAVKKILLENQFASPYMVKYSIEALYLLGEPEAAEQRMKESYSRDVPLADPTFSEGWGGSGTKNHGWSGGGLIGLSGYAAGVRPLASGYDKVLVKPQLGDQITDLNAVIPTIKGDMNVVIAKTDDQFNLSVNIPENSEGLVGIPRMAKGTAVYCGDTLVWNDGQLADTVEGLTYASNDFSHIYFTADSGDWSFTAANAVKGSEEAYTLTIAAVKNGSVKVNGETVALPYTNSFAAGTEVTVEAAADEGYVFESYDGTIGARTAAVTVTMDANQTLNAHFAQLWDFNGVTLAITVNRPYAAVTVNGKKVETPFYNQVTAGTEVTLEALENEEILFAQWQDGQGKMISEEPVLTLTLDTDTEVRAMFISRYGENLALNKSVTTSSSVTGNQMFGNDKAVDGIYTIKGSNEGWTSLETADTQWIQVDLGEIYGVNRVKLVPRNNGTDDGYGIPINMEILVSENGSDWKQVYAVTDLERPLVDYLVYDFAETNARYVKINGSVLRQNPADGNRKRFQLSELEVYGTDQEALKNNLALNKSVEVSSAQPVSKFSPAFATDGRYTEIGSNEGWTSYPVDSAWITVDLGQDCTVREVALFPRVDGSNDGYGIPVDLEILVSLDGEKWTEVYAVTGQPYAGSSALNYRFADTPARYVKVNGSKLRPNPADGNQYRFQLAELEVYGDVGVAEVKSNLALNQPVTVSSSQAVVYFSPDFVTDGVYTEKLTNEGWTSMPNNETEWVTVDLGHPSAIDEVKLFPRKDGVNDGYGIPVDMEILVSADGQTWTEIYAVTDLERPLDECLSYEFDNVVGRYVKIHGSKLRVNPKDMNQKRMQLAELEVYGAYLDPAAAAAYLIDAIGEVTLDSGDAIAAARAAYEAVPDAQKAEVENLAVLEAAEARYDYLLKWQTGVTLTLSGTESVFVEQETLTYTVSAANMVDLATAVVVLEYNGDMLCDPQLTGRNGFEVLTTFQKENRVDVFLVSMDGTTSEEALEILEVTFQTSGSTGEAAVAITEATLSAYVGEGEAFAKVDFSQASFSTKVDFSFYDVNRDGTVDMLDLTRIQRWYGTADPICDLDKNGTVNVSDMVLVVLNYSKK